MPTYEYICEACDHSFDEFQYFSEDPLTKCPACKKKKLRRAFGTGAAVLFKGSGFYETDYRSESYKSGAKAESDATKPATETKSDAKSDAPAKSESKPSTNGTTGKTSKGGKAK
jgi:putative FmdB family regulatory protein